MNSRKAVCIECNIKNLKRLETCLATGNCNIDRNF